MFEKFKGSAQNFIFKLHSTAASILNASEENRRVSLLQSSAKHLHGPLYVALEPDEAIVLCVVKDGESLVHSFIEHYLELGFKHIFFLDNGSTDKTVEIIQKYRQTTVVSSSEPFEKYYVTFKNFLIQTFGQGKWCVVADIDEFLNFPLSRHLEDVLVYLNQHGYDTVCVQMLDMFSKEGIAISRRRDSWSLERLKSTFCYYDLSDIGRRKYVRRFQSPAHQGLRFLYGGIRKTVFKRDCFLTKEVFFWAHGGTRLKSSHLLKRAKLADFSVAFLHYKFAENFYSSTVKAVAQQNHWRKSHEYKAYLAILEQKQGTLSLFQSSSLVFEEIDDLISSNFLFVSDKFRTFCPSPCEV